MDKIPYILYKGLEEMILADELLSSLYGSERMVNVKRAYSVSGRYKGYVVIRDGVNKFGYDTPYGVDDPKSNYVEVKLTLDMENE